LILPEEMKKLVQEPTYKTQIFPYETRITNCHRKTPRSISIVHLYSLLLRGNFFQCHVFAMKSVQNLKSFWRSSQNDFLLALFSSL
jgi:hypothetical protein